MNNTEQILAQIRKHEPINISYIMRKYKLSFDGSKKILERAMHIYEGKDWK